MAKNIILNRAMEYWQKSGQLPQTKVSQKMAKNIILNGSMEHWQKSGQQDNT